MANQWEGKTTANYWENAIFYIIWEKNKESCKSEVLDGKQWSISDMLFPRWLSSLVYLIHGSLTRSFVSVATEEREREQPVATANERGYQS